MTDVNVTLVDVLADRYVANAVRVHELAAPIDEGQFWQKPLPSATALDILCCTSPAI